LKDVAVRYGDRTIIEGINWSIYAGESWALIGPNGSGKTTLLSLIMGDHPQAYMNEVIVFGKRRGSGESIWALKKNIGAVSPELHLHFNGHATCNEVILSGFSDSIGLVEEATARQKTMAGSWLKRFEIANFSDMPLQGLSLGWQRMVLLGRALVKSPKLLILDEPCQGLDPKNARKLLSLIDRIIREQRATVIYVTHRIEEIPLSIRKTFDLGSRTKIMRNENARAEV
jgi:molybdate transport system ATP-binding protein